MCWESCFYFPGRHSGIHSYLLISLNNLAALTTPTGCNPCRFYVGFSGVSKTSRKGFDV